MDDDLYPNDGTYFLPQEPAEQKIARKKEMASTLEGIDVLKEQIERFEERIKFYEANSSIPDEVRVDPAKFLVMHNTYSLMAKTLISEKEYIEQLISEHAPRI